MKKLNLNVDVNRDMKAKDLKKAFILAVRTFNGLIDFIKDQNADQCVILYSDGYRFKKPVEYGLIKVTNQAWYMLVEIAYQIIGDDRIFDIENSEDRDYKRLTWKEIIDICFNELDMIESGARTSLFGAFNEIREEESTISRISETSVTKA
jgi:hypothetical protein